MCYPVQYPTLSETPCTLDLEKNSLFGTPCRKKLNKGVKRNRNLATHIVRKGSRERPNFPWKRPIKSSFRLFSTGKWTDENIRKHVFNFQCLIFRRFGVLPYHLRHNFWTLLRKQQLVICDVANDIFLKIFWRTSF